MQLFREVTTLDQKKTQSLNDNNKGYENALFEMIEALYLEFGQVNKYVNDLHKCFFPDVKPGIAKTFDNLQEQLNNLPDSKETLKAHQDELDEYREKAEHLKSLLDFRDYENNKLREELKLKDAENKMLIQWIDKLNLRISRFLKSKEWRVGYFFGELMRKLLRRPSNKKLEDKICEIFLDYDSWQKVRDNQIKE